jgi:hypothetical protein
MGHHGNRAFRKLVGGLNGLWQRPYARRRGGCSAAGTEGHAGSGTATGRLAS